MAHNGETEIEMVQRHIRQGEESVTSQRKVVASLPPDSALEKTAPALGPVRRRPGKPSRTSDPAAEPKSGSRSVDTSHFLSFKPFKPGSSD